jgi:hypothetical protein
VALAAPWRMWIKAQAAFFLGDYDTALIHLRWLSQQPLHGPGAFPATASPALASADIIAVPSADQVGWKISHGRESAIAICCPNLPWVKLRLDQPHMGPRFLYLQVGQLILELQAAQKLRSEGNNLMKANKFADAVEKYTEALSGGCL